MALVWIVSFSSQAFAQGSEDLFFSIKKQMPAPFGIVIGDEIVHDYFVQTRSPYQFKASSLPQKSKLNYWLNLKNVEITEKENRQGTEVHLKLTYQTFYAPIALCPHKDPI